jgi:hypothetical protein
MSDDPFSIWPEVVDAEKLKELGISQQALFLDTEINTLRVDIETYGVTRTKPNLLLRAVREMMKSTEGDFEC